MSVKHPLKDKKVFNTNHLISDWFYMQEDIISLEQIHATLSGFPEVQAEFWPDAGYLEIILPDGASIDFESEENLFTEPADKQFAEEHHIKTVFSVSFPPECYQPAMEVFRFLLERLNGMFCADTEAFQPRMKME